jgi:hypothetical protein
MVQLQDTVYIIYSSKELQGLSNGTIKFQIFKIFKFFKFSKKSQGLSNGTLQGLSNGTNGTIQGLSIGACAAGVRVRVVVEVEIDMLF